MAIARALAGLLSELLPPSSARCGRRAWSGALRVIAGAVRGLFARSRSARVTVAGQARISVDLRTPHGRRIFAYGFCEPAAQAMRALLNSGDFVIDGGANIGLFTMLAAVHVGKSGGVIACEPSPNTMSLLRANVADNGFDHVELREVALAEAPGSLRMHVFEPGSGYSSFAPLSIDGGTEVDVEVTTLDELASHVAGRIGLVKLDVEGAELRALRGASHLLAASRPDVILELEPEHLARQGCSIGEVQALFNDAGYVGYSIADGLKRLPETWTKPAGDPNIVVRPRERASD